VISDEVKGGKYYLGLQVKDMVCGRHNVGGSERYASQVGNIIRREFSGQASRAGNRLTGYAKRWKEKGESRAVIATQNGKNQPLDRGVTTRRKGLRTIAGSYSSAWSFSLGKDK